MDAEVRTQRGSVSTSQASSSAHAPTLGPAGVSSPFPSSFSLQLSRGVDARGGFESLISQRSQRQLARLLLKRAPGYPGPRLIPCKPRREARSSGEGDPRRNRGPQSPPAGSAITSVVRGEQRATDSNNNNTSPVQHAVLICLHVCVLPTVETLGPESLEVRAASAREGQAQATQSRECQADTNPGQEKKENLVFRSLEPCTAINK